MKRPPLEAARVVRARKVDATVEEMRTAAAAAARAGENAERARAAEREARENAERAESEERVSLETQTQRSARDLAQLAAFEVGHALEHERLAARTAATARDAETARDQELSQRSKLGTARADLHAVEKHQAKWRANEEKRVQDKADEAAEESHAARRRR